MKENVKRLEDEKYRCAFCSKLFKGDEFVRKHIVLKHVENITEVRQKALEEQFFLNYWEDPRHIHPVTNQQQQQQQKNNRTPQGGLMHPPQWENPQQQGLLHRPPGPPNRMTPQRGFPVPRTSGIPLPVPLRPSPQARRQENRFVQCLRSFRVLFSVTDTLPSLQGELWRHLHPRKLDSTILELFAST